MSILNHKYKALIVAGFISGLLVIGIASLSSRTPQKSLLEFDQPAFPCALSICSLI